MKTLLEIGDLAPDFSLVGTDGLIYSINQFKGHRAIVVFFTCNLCPYARGIEQYIKKQANEFHKKGVIFLGINSNNEGPDTYEQMIALMEENQFPWKYLQDPAQRIAKKYNALATPHFFLFDHHRMLVYSGRALENPLQANVEGKEYLKDALEELLDLKPVTVSETAPVGSAIRWNESEVSEEQLVLV